MVFYLSWLCTLYNVCGITIITMLCLSFSITDDDPFL
jgi:hypothetical protein